MKAWIRRWLGITELREQNIYILDSREAIIDELLKLRNELIVTFNDEHSPKRKAMSNELGKRMEAKLIAEDKARKLTTGEL